MTRVLIWLSACLTIAAPLALSASCPEPTHLYPSAHVSIQQYQDLYDSFTRRPDTHCKDFGPHQVQCNSDSIGEIWWFTRPGHPAHAAASRGQMMYNTQTQEACLVRDSYFAGDETAFASWLVELKHYDDQTVARFRAGQ